MTKHVFKLAGADGSSDVEILRSWLRENTSGGIAEIRPAPTTEMDSILAMRSTVPPVVRVYFEITVHGDDEAFWTKMRWGEDMVAYEDARRAREVQSDRFIERYHSSQNHPWGHPWGAGFARASSAQSKVIPAFRPQTTAAVTKTGKKVVDDMLREIIKIDSEEKLIEAFCGVEHGPTRP